MTATDRNSAQRTQVAEALAVHVDADHPVRSELQLERHRPAGSVAHGRDALRHSPELQHPRQAVDGHLKVRNSWIICRRGAD